MFFRICLRPQEKFFEPVQSQKTRPLSTKDTYGLQNRGKQHTIFLASVYDVY